MKLLDSIFCIVKGHKYSRFERRNPLCIHCGKTRKDTKSQKDDMDRRGTSSVEDQSHEVEMSLTH